MTINHPVTLIGLCQYVSGLDGKRLKFSADRSVLIVKCVADISVLIVKLLADTSVLIVKRFS